MDAHLRSMWEEINRLYFGGALQPLVDIDWGETSGPNGIGALGVYKDRARCIILDEKYRFDVAAIKAGDKAENANLEIAYRLLMHEMVHQALHEQNGRRSGGHGAAFLEEARRIACQMGEPEPTQDQVEHWPLVWGNPNAKA